MKDYNSDMTSGKWAPGRIVLSGALFLLTALGLTVPVQAVRATEVLEEVLVVAQRRTENLQDTPIAITVLSGNTLDELNISNPSDFEAIVPSLSLAVAM